MSRSTSVARSCRRRSAICLESGVHAPRSSVRRCTSPSGYGRSHVHAIRTRPNNRTRSGPDVRPEPGRAPSRRRTTNDPHSPWRHMLVRCNGLTRPHRNRACSSSPFTARGLRLRRREQLDRCARLARRIEVAPALGPRSRRVGSGRGVGNSSIAAAGSRVASKSRPGFVTAHCGSVPAAAWGTT
jgi:hypothetical protein